MFLMSANSEISTRRRAVANLLLFQTAVLFRAEPGRSTDEPFKRFDVGGGSLSIPPLGIGTWAWGDQDVWGYGGYDKDFDDNSIKAAFDACIKAGITFFDTAEVYGTGRSEEIIGRLISDLPAKSRANISIATKFYPVDPKTNLPRLLFPGDLLSALDASRRRLGVDSVDLYQIHAPLIGASAEAVADALAEAVLSGRCKAVGVSNYALDEMAAVQRRLDRRGLRLASNQVEFSLLRQLPETSGLLAACRDMGVGVLAYSPLAMGRLSGKYSAARRPRGTRFFSNYPMDQVEPLLAAARDIGERHGGKTPAQARDNAGALGWRLDAEEVDRLGRLGRVGGTSVWQHDGR